MRVLSLFDGISCVSAIHRYNTCGNGWTVDVIAHILKGLK